jgi:hypothetical protein
LECWRCNPVDVVHEIMGNEGLWDSMNYIPIRIFADDTCKEQIYNEMWTGEWWWEIQVWFLTIYTAMDIKSSFS